MGINVAHGFRQKVEFRPESAGKNSHQLLLGHRGKRPARSADASAGIFSFPARTSFPVPHATQSQKPPLKCAAGCARRAGPALGAGWARKGRSRFPLPRPCPRNGGPRIPRARDGRGPREEGSAPRLPTSPPRPGGGGGESERSRQSG